MDEKLRELLPKAKRESLDNWYKKSFEEQLELELKAKAQTHARRVVREMMRDPKLQREIRQLTKKTLRTKLPSIVREFVDKVKLYHKDW